MLSHTSLNSASDTVPRFGSRLSNFYYFIPRFYMIVLETATEASCVFVCYS